MDNLIKLPFIETNISLLDFNKLEKNGCLRQIFIELLKAEKIKNVIPTEYQIKVSAEELILKKNNNQINKEKNNQYYIDLFKKEVIKLASLKKLSIDKFGKEAEKTFN